MRTVTTYTPTPRGGPAGVARLPRCRRRGHPGRAGAALADVGATDRGVRRRGGDVPGGRGAVGRRSVPVITADPAAPPGSGEGFPDGCNQVDVRVLEGDSQGTRTTIDVPPGVAESGLRAGDELKVVAIPAQDDRPASYGYFGTQRTVPILWLTVMFVVVVALVARVRGLLALLGLVFAGVVVREVHAARAAAGVLRASRWPWSAPRRSCSWCSTSRTGSRCVRRPRWPAPSSASRSSPRSALYAVEAARLSGLGEEGELLRAHAPDLNFRGLLTCAVDRRRPRHPQRRDDHPEPRRCGSCGPRRPR